MPQRNGYFPFPPDLPRSHCQMVRSVAAPISMLCMISKFGTGPDFRSHWVHAGHHRCSVGGGVVPIDPDTNIATQTIDKLRPAELSHVATPMVIGNFPTVARRPRTVYAMQISGESRAICRPERQLPDRTAPLSSRPMNLVPTRPIKLRISCQCRPVRFSEFQAIVWR